MHHTWYEMKILSFPIIPGCRVFFILSVCPFMICWRDKRSFGRSRLISGTEVIRRIPNIRQKNLKSGVLYHDGQFDDARLAVSLALTAMNREPPLNYFRVTALTKEKNKINGLIARDQETGILIRSGQKRSLMQPVFLWMK